MVTERNQANKIDTLEIKTKTNDHTTRTTGYQESKVQVVDCCIVFEQFCGDAEEINHVVEDVDALDATRLLTHKLLHVLLVVGAECIQELQHHRHVFDLAGGHLSEVGFLITFVLKMLHERTRGNSNTYIKQNTNKNIYE
jgi:hypothetical protein